MQTTFFTKSALVIDVKTVGKRRDITLIFSSTTKLHYIYTVTPNK